MENAGAVIVGAGPAGLGAAVELARRGLVPVILDENPAVGGQIYKQPAGLTDASPLSLPLASSRMGTALLQEARSVQPSLRHLPEACVIGLDEDLQLIYAHHGTVHRLQAQTVLLALGAYDRVIPFPGWELPGVITVGGLQTLLKHHGILPGARIVLAGAGLLLLLVAAQMTAAGHPPAAVIEATGRSELLRALPGLLRQPSLLREGLYLLRLLRRGGVRLWRRYAVVRAHGSKCVEAIEISPVDAHWQPDCSRSITLATDCLAIGFGLVPEVALVRLAGAALTYRPELGGWVPQHNGDMETSKAGLFVAGDGCGIRGAEIAQLQGRLAGMAMAERLGVWRGSSDQAAKQRLQADLTRRMRARYGLERAFRTRSGIYACLDDETLLCRCEEIPWGEVQAWLERGLSSATQLKMATRVGMGRCQGRFCAPNLRDLLARQLGDQANLDDSLTARPPVKPLSLGTLAGLAEE